MIRKRHALTAALAMTALAACGGSSDDGPAVGTLNLKLTDSPVDSAKEAVVFFTGLEIQPSDGERISFDFCDLDTDPENCRSIDLLTLQGGVTVNLLDGVTVDAGQYDWIRLKVVADRETNDRSYIKFEDDSQFPLWVPSGDQSGLKLNRTFFVAQGGVTNLVIDFDLRKSVTLPARPGMDTYYILRPTLRMMDELLTGDIMGQVDIDALATEQEAETCVPGVYLFSGFDAVPDDMDREPDDGADPVVYMKLEPDEVGGTVASYMIPYVEAGEHTVAFTCDYDVDAAADVSEYDPTAAEGEAGFQTMRWSTQNVSVNPDDTATADFPVPPET